MSKETGGPVFPTTVRGAPVGRNMKPLQRLEGMSLRDYFAAKVMQADLGDPQTADSVSSEEIARHAYEVADIMLEVRK